MSNSEKFQKIKYIEGFKQACIAVNNPRFKHLNELGDDFFEGEFANGHISINTPTYIGFVILQYAKLHMLSFYYDCLDKFIGREKFEMAYMDTDSCYFGLAGKTLRECVKPNLLPIFERNVYGSCKDDFDGDDFKTVWFPRECCQKHNKYDLRFPGCMKLEHQGTQLVGLSSKSYLAVDQNTSTIKYSLKGVNNQFVDPSDPFKEVLHTQCPVMAVNRGIRCFDNSVFTYTQPKQAFTYFYCKRLILPCGNRSRPLDITLKPINKYKKRQDEFYQETLRILESMDT